MFRRTRGMLVAAGAAAAVVLTPLGAHATTVINEGFETAPPSFTLYGNNSTRDCTLGTAHGGACSLLVDPVSTSTTIGASYSSSTSMGSLATVTFWFRASSTSGDLDGDFIVTLNGGHQVRIHPTEGSGTNNGISLYTSSGNDASFDSWASANTWYRFQLHFDTVNDTVYATGPNATSATKSIPSGASSITSIDARGIEWNSTSNTLRYDDITVDTCTYNLLGLCV